MGLIRNRKILVMVFVIVMVVAVGFVLTATPASAASKKTLKLIKDKRITYYKTGLVKKIVEEFPEGKTESTYKYNKAGRITSIVYCYDDRKETSEHYLFKYTKKGKLKSISNVDRQTSYTYKAKVKSDKKKKITTIKLYSNEGFRSVVKYDSKGRIKYYKRYAYDLPGVLNYTITSKIKWDSKGFIKRIDGDDTDEFNPGHITFHTKVKSGLAKKITVTHGYNPEYTDTYTFKHAKKKIKKKYVKAVKAQQRNLLYWDCRGFLVDFDDFVLFLQI